jgi:hypothetical protein
MCKVPIKAFVLHTSCTERIVSDSLEVAKEEFVLQTAHAEPGYIKLHKEEFLLLTSCYQNEMH